MIFSIRYMLYGFSAISKFQDHLKREDNYDIPMSEK